MRKLEETPDAIRDELIMGINEIRTYGELEKRGNIHLLRIYGVLESLQGQMSVSHRRLASRLPCGLYHALKTLKEAQVLTEKAEGYVGSEDLLRIKKANYTLTRAGRGFRDDFMLKANRLG